MYIVVLLPSPDDDPVTLNEPVADQSLASIVPSTARTRQ
jgi:hypothetical protein